MKKALYAALALLPGLCFAQVAASKPEPAASAVVVPASPADKAVSMTKPPGELRPSQPVLPQVAVPLRRGSGDKPARPLPPASGVVDDAAARCVAMETESARADCRREAALR